MTEESLIAATRAETKADFAHERLDKMNGSIDRLGTAVTDTRTELGAKIDGLALQMATRAGSDQEDDRRKTGFYYRLQNLGVIVGVCSLIVAVIAVSGAAHWIR